MAHLAYGSQFCVAAPHQQSTLMGMHEYLVSRHAHSAALATALSLTLNLPHLCGLGGDAIIMHKHGQRIRTINGTGRTGRHQHRASYIDKGLDTIPRRGVYSTMVYGCPSAYDRYVKQNDLDLERLTNMLVAHDLRGGLARSPGVCRAYQSAQHEHHSATNFKNWDAFLRGGECMVGRYIKTLRTVARRGIGAFYTGTLADQTFSTLSKADPELYDEDDFLRFTPNPAETKSIQFLHATITVQGHNSPWRELFLLLKVYEHAVVAQRPLHPRAACTAAGLIDQLLSCARPYGPDYAEQITADAQKLFHDVEPSDARPVAQTARQSHTIFLACAEASGQLVGITNSIFTPLGALFEIDETGILLSNRCFSFNAVTDPTAFKAGAPAQHTNNCVHVETDAMELILGTSGGPVQTQTLAQIVHAVVAMGLDVRTAVSQPRHANMGLHPKTRQITYLIEGPAPDPAFESIDGISNKLGIAQLAGREKTSGRVFAVADPRGEGIALGL